ncbi:MAG: hypothetical protein VYD05_14640, partial [Planctomycetota bacterium]|nr:hypothetical protein [Planctomycetota bacterium]
MNHGHDELDDVVMALARAGYEVQLGVNLAQSHHLAGQGRPDVVLMNALAACEGGAELDLLEQMQADDDPIPVILLIDDRAELREARKAKVPFRDFVLKPSTPAEIINRVELAIQTRARVRELLSRARQLES